MVALAQVLPARECGQHHAGLAQRGDIAHRRVLPCHGDHAVGGGGSQAGTQRRCPPCAQHGCHARPLAGCQPEHGVGGGPTDHGGEDVGDAAGGGARAGGIEQRVRPDRGCDAQRNGQVHPVGAGGQQTQTDDHDRDAGDLHQAEVVGEEQHTTDGRQRCAATAGHRVAHREVADGVRLRQQPQVRQVHHPAQRRPQVGDTGHAEQQMVPDGERQGQHAGHEELCPQHEVAIAGGPLGQQVPPGVDDGRSQREESGEQHGGVSLRPPSVPLGVTSTSSPTGGRTGR
jgi:hypothetical protein